MGGNQPNQQPIPELNSQLMIAGMHAICQPVRQIVEATLRPGARRIPFLTLRRREGGENDACDKLADISRDARENCGLIRS